MPIPRSRRSAERVSGAAPVAISSAGLAWAQPATTSAENASRRAGLCPPKRQSAARSSRFARIASSVSNRVTAIPCRAAARSRLAPTCVPSKAPTIASPLPGGMAARSVSTACGGPVIVPRGARSCARPGHGDANRGKCRRQPRFALGITPPRDNVAAGLPHALAQRRIGDQRTQRIGQGGDVSGRKNDARCRHRGPDPARSRSPKRRRSAARRTSPR